MSTTTPQDEGAAIIAHYLKTLARAAGLRWTDQNDLDIRRACELLGSDTAAAALPSIPPYSSGALARPVRPAPGTPAPQPKRDPRNATAEENRQAAEDLRLMNAANRNVPSAYQTVKTIRGDE